MAERQAITKEMARRYARATKKQRGLMLDELCALTGYNRSYAARLAASVKMVYRHENGPGASCRPAPAAVG